MATNFDPTKAFSDNVAGVAGADWYRKVATTMGGNSSDPWNSAINGLRTDFDALNKNDATAVQGWTNKVRSLTGGGQAPTVPGAGAGGVGGTPAGGGASMGSGLGGGGTGAGGSFDGGLGRLMENSQYTASTSAYDESKGVAGRIQALTDQGSPLMAAARTRSAKAAARMGLQNSTMSAQAGEQAVIDSAAPIATADAQLYNQQQLANQNALNSASANNAQLRTQVGLTGMNLMEQRRQFDTQLGQQDRQFQSTLQLQKDELAAQREQFAQQLGMSQKQLDLNRDQLSQQDRQFLADLDQKQQQLAQQESQFVRDQQNKVTLANLDATNRERLIEIEAKYKTDISSSENISRAWGTMMDSINQIQNNPDLDYSTKSQLISNTQASFQSFANFWKKATGGSTDVSDLLQFGQAPVGPSRPTAPGSNYPYEYDNTNPGGFVPAGERGG